MPKASFRHDGKLIVLSGPSGVGKGTLVRKLLKRVPELLVSVSATTREPRLGEIDGEDYFFLTKKEFELGIEKGAFLEWALVYGELYGTPQKPLDEAIKQGKTVLLEIDVQGALQVKKKKGDEAVYIFVEPPSIEELKNRLIGRSTETEAAQEKRLDVAIKELEHSGEYDYVVINDKLDVATDRLLEIISK